MHVYNISPFYFNLQAGVKEYKASKLVHLLLHEEKTAELPLQINEILHEEDREKKKRR